MGVYDIQGNNCVFQLKIGDDYKTVVCAKSFTFNPITDMKETTTVGSGFWKEYRPRKLSYTITFNGMLQVEALPAQEIAKTMLVRQIQFFPFEYQMIYRDNSNNVMIVRGSVYITSSIFDASPANLVNSTQEMQGTGPIELLDQLPQPININITSTGDPGIGALIQFKLYNADGDIVFDSGQLPAASGGNLTHPVNVTGQVQAGSYYYFWQVTSDSVGNTFDLDAPPTKNTVFNDATVNENSYGVQIYDFTADRNVDFSFGTVSPPPSCVAPAIVSDLNNPSGTVGTYWVGTVVLSGSEPFSLSAITKPTWMTISVATNIVTLQGMPDAGINQPIAFTVSNACGSVDYVDTIDIASNPDAIILNYNYVEDAGVPASGCSFRIFVNAVLVANLATTGSSNYLLNAGDVVEVRIVGLSVVVKHLDVQDTIDGEIHNQTATGTTISYMFTAILGHDYTINGSAENP